MERMTNEFTAVVERIVSAAEQRLRDEMHTLFDSLAHRLDRLKPGYHCSSPE